VVSKREVINMASDFVEELKEAERLDAENPGIERTTAILKALLAGRDVVCTTEWDKACKASLLKDIAKAKKLGYQLSIPFS
jgi:hypothetical protein